MIKRVMHLVIVFDSMVRLDVTFLSLIILVQFSNLCNRKLIEMINDVVKKLLPQISTLKNQFM